MTGPRPAYRPIGENPARADRDTVPEATLPLVHADDDDPRDDSAAPDD